MMKIGERVGAILGAKDGKCEFLGFGVYEGDFFPEEAIGFFAQIKRELVAEGKLTKEESTNPKIKLDDGKIVYGCECWWGDEEKVKKMLKQYKEVINVDIDKIREEHKKNEIS